MGGKTKKYYGLTSSQIYDTDDDLFAIDMLRHWAITKNIPKVVEGMVNNINAYFNTKYLEHFGAIGTVESDVYLYSLNSIASYIKQKDYHKIVVPFYSETNDINGKAVEITKYSIVEQLKKKYSFDYSHIYTHTDTLEFEASTKSVDGYIPSDVAMEMYGTTKITAEFEFESYAFDIDGKKWKLLPTIPYGLNDGTLEWATTLVNIDNEDDKRIEIIYPSERVYYGIKYAYKDSKNEAWKDDVIIIPKDELIAEAGKLHMLVLPIKNNYQYYDDKFTNLLLGSYGFDIDDFKEALDQDEVRGALITYSTNKERAKKFPQIEEVIHNLYFTGNDMEVKEDVYHISYTSQITYGGGGIGNECSYLEEFGYKCKSATSTAVIIVGGHTFSDLDGEKAGDGLYMVPVEAILDLKFKDRYEAINQYMSIWGSMYKEVHLKWYQTGFFKIAFALLGIAFAFVTGGASAALMTIGGMALSFALGKLLGPIGQLLGGLIMLGFGTGGFSLSRMIDGIMNNIFKISIEFVKVIRDIQFQGKYDALTKEIEVVKDGMEESIEDLKEIMKPAIFMPLDTQRTMFDMQYQLQFAPYNSANYDMHKTLFRGRDNAF